MMEVASAFSDNNDWSLFSYNIRSSTGRTKESFVPINPVPYKLWGSTESQISEMLGTILDRMKTDVLDPSSSSEEELCHKCEVKSSEELSQHRRLKLSPSRFSHGCICGHKVEIRELVYDARKRRNTRCPGITIRPKTPPITVNLRT